MKVVGEEIVPEGGDYGGGGIADVKGKEERGGISFL